MTCDPERLSVLSAPFKAVPEGNKLNILIYVFSLIANVTTDPQKLSQLAKCFQCIPDGNKMNVLLYLACNFQGGGTGATCVTGGNTPPVGVPPCNYSVWIQGPGPNFGVWFGDTNGWSSIPAIAQGP